MNPFQVWLRPAETLVNHALRLDPEARQRFGEFDGRCLRVRVMFREGAIQEMDLLPSDAGLRFEWVTPERTADVTFTGTPALFRHVLTGRGAADVELSIRGDVGLGNRFREAIESVEIDWEDALSRWTGDVIAHEVGRAARGFRRFATDAVERLGQHTRDYLTEETRILARKHEVASFVDAVRALNVMADRIERRIAQLEAR